MCTQGNNLHLTPVGVGRFDSVFPRMLTRDDVDPMKYKSGLAWNNSEIRHNSFLRKLSKCNGSTPPFSLNSLQEVVRIPLAGKPNMT